MQVFDRVAETKSFSVVARDLGATQSGVSKQIARLEHHYGVRLFDRSTRVVHLTDEGIRLLEYGRRMLALSEEAQAAVGHRGEPVGLVRIGAPSAFSRLYLAARTAALLRLHQTLRVELVADDGDGDLVEQGIDIAIRFNDLEDTAAIARRVGTTTRVTVATPAYLARCGEPATPADLVAHNCLIYTQLSPARVWQFSGPAGPVAVTVAGNYLTNSAEIVREGVLAGIGIAVMPDWLFRDEIADGRLRPILCEFAPRSLAIHLVHPSRRFVAPKIRTVLDYLGDALGNDPTLGR
jgi:DNA-binding transcriptional LysR family regulator